jgi:TonB family protein
MRHEWERTGKAWVRGFLKTILILIGLSVIVPFVPIAAQDDLLVRDEDIKTVDFAELRYPLGARLSHVQGVVVVRVKLDANGHVTDSEAVSGAKSLIADCLANSKKWLFQPNPKKEVVLVYEFRIDRGLCHGGNVASQFVFREPNFASITSCEAQVEP